MKKKIIFGTSLIILFFSLFIFFYFKSSSEKKLIERKKIELIENKNEEQSKQKLENSNIIEDVSYSAKDSKGNEYFLKADEGVIDQNDSNYI